MIKYFSILIIVLIVNTAYCQQQAYKNSSLPIEVRVNDLLQRMTIEEQAAQLFSIFSRDTAAFDKYGNFVSTLDTAIINHGAGSLGTWSLWRERSLRRRVQCFNGIQRYMMEKTRLGIPIFTFGESLHGFMADGATSFPQAIALGCTWDTVLIEQLFTAAALEASSRGTRQVLSPVVDLARDPRWGRTEECYGEDPYLVSRLGMAAVFGFQGRDSIIDNHHVAVTLKHFAGHGQSEGGRNIAPVSFSDREFRENHLYPFEMAVTKAHARSLMASYNEWDGVPNHVNHKLLTDILRGEWGFNGYVMSDGGGMDVTYREHHAASDSIESGILSLNAGLDYELGRGTCFAGLAEQVKKGKVNESAIRRAAANVLRVKFECGLFEAPYADVDLMERVTNSKEHKALALKAANEAMVLLKNEKTLPFDQTKIKKLAVIGPNAADIHLGGYSAIPMKGVSVLQGIKDFAKGKFEVQYAEGCKLTLNKECHWQVNENPILGDPENDKKLISEAVKTAQKSDAVVLVLGENELICREAWSENHLGDRDNLDLVGRQNDLADAILQTGKPVVVLLINGRPITINEIHKKAPAIIECWYLGQETGHAVADVIFGKVNPSGKLTVTFPRSVGQLPCYYDHKPSRFRSYVLSDSSPLYPFGFGLSYTHFEYSNLRIAPKNIQTNGTVEVSIDVQNSGAVEGDEIVQLYIHAIISLPTRPVKELKDFTRIHLKPGELRTMRFTLTLDKLAAIGFDMKRIVPAGAYEIMVGKNSLDVVRDTLIVQ
ncbi:MAG: glycoside hydrolase family 3 C-terminal domain-containing protein [Ignavibacteriales bacterium]|nr:glycoside hydrolase family 3 C-terminal domain-containing protein [Ignavibacteriales bacterium]